MLTGRSLCGGFKHAPQDSNALGIKDIERGMTIGITERGAKHSAKQAQQRRGQPLHPNSMRTGTSNSRFKTRFLNY